MNKEEKEKIYIYSIIIITAIIVVLVIAIIWNPMIKNKETINTYDDSITYESTMKQYYKKYVADNLRIDRFDELYSRIDNDYLNSIGLTDEDEVKEYLKQNKIISMTYEINNIEMFISDSKHMFLITYTIENNQKYIIIEEEKPYNFKISFVKNNNLSELLSKTNISKTVEDVEYDMCTIDSTRNSIRMKLTIKNNSNKTYEYDFSNLNYLQLKYGNDEYVNMAAIANSSTVNYAITPGSEKSIEVLFNLSLSDQLNISGFKLNNVKRDSNTYTLEI